MSIDRFQAIRQAVRKLTFAHHAVQRLFQRGISAADVERVVAPGEVIESYPEDKPFPSRLILGWFGGAPLHVLAADDPASDETRIITVYEPSPERWEPDWKTRKARR